MLAVVQKMNVENCSSESKNELKILQVTYLKGFFLHFKRLRNSVQKR